MLRTIYTPDSNLIHVMIPERYIGAKLEVLVFPVNEVMTPDIARITSDVDDSFGGWADMDKTAEEICSEIRASRIFCNKTFDLS